MTEIYVGTSGFSYSHWKEVFYPEELSSKEWFKFYQERFTTVELNTTFYHLPKEKIVKGWADKSKANFVFSLKASRYITHVKKLKDPDKTVEKFYNAVSGLKKKTGPVLFQLSESAKKNTERLKVFLRTLKKHKGPKVLELRNPSWWPYEIFGEFKKNSVCRCRLSAAGEIPL